MSEDDILRQLEVLGRKATRQQLNNALRDDGVVVGERDFLRLYARAFESGSKDDDYRIPIRTPRSKPATPAKETAPMPTSANGTAKTARGANAAKAKEIIRRLGRGCTWDQFNAEAAKQGFFMATASYYYHRSTIFGDVDLRNGKVLGERPAIDQPAAELTGEVTPPPATIALDAADFDTPAEKPVEFATAEFASAFRQPAHSPAPPPADEPPPVHEALDEMLRGLRLRRRGPHQVLLQLRAVVRWAGGIKQLREMLDTLETLQQL